MSNVNFSGYTYDAPIRNNNMLRPLSRDEIELAQSCIKDDEERAKREALMKPTPRKRSNAGRKRNPKWTREFIIDCLAIYYANFYEGDRKRADAFFEGTQGITLNRVRQLAAEYGLAVQMHFSLIDKNTGRQSPIAPCKAY